jgi:flavin-dependent dehydrogenase
MNLGIEDLPPSCNVLVVGAGPAGSAAATLLARGGLDVVLIDQQAFPRDKICGDGLIPDAHHALRTLGVFDAVMAQARAATHVRCVGPRGAHIDVPGELAVLPRKQLDDIVPWVLLATGAVPQALIAAGMVERQTPSGVALRGYVRNERMAERVTALEVVWHRALAPGYGWIFPCRDGVFNIGVGIADSHTQRQDGRYRKIESNLHRVMQDFQSVYAPARDLMSDGVPLSPMKGAPLRCTLEGAKLTRPGMLVLGEAAGSTYSFTVEGIGKALETGIHAAQSVLAAPERSAAADARVRADYEARLASLKPRFELYRRANVVNRHPWLTDLLIWRANQSPRIVRRMSGVLEETSNPGNLVSVKGIARLFLDRR